MDTTDTAELETTRATSAVAAPQHQVRGMRGDSLARVLRLVEESLEQRLRVEDLARAACLSPFHFARMFKLSTGQTPHGYLVARRIDRARELLMKDALSIREIAAKSGFRTQAHFCGVFRTVVGTTPGAFRRQHQAKAPAA